MNSVPWLSALWLVPLAGAAVAIIVPAAVAATRQMGRSGRGAGRARAGDR